MTQITMYPHLPESFEYAIEQIAAEDFPIAAIRDHFAHFADTLYFTITIRDDVQHAVFLPLGESDGRHDAYALAGIGYAHQFDEFVWMEVGMVEDLVMALQLSGYALRKLMIDSPLA